MLRRLLSLTAKDLKVVTRNHYLTVVVAVAVIYALAINFLLPAQLAVSPEVVVWDTTQSQTMRQLYEAAQKADGGGGRVIVVESRAEFDKAMKLTGNRLGLEVAGGALPERIVVTYQGYENARTRRLLEATLQTQVARIRAVVGGVEGAWPVFETDTLRTTSPAERPPFNISLLPVFIYTEAVMVGLILVAALLYSEKEEGTLRGYRVTPGRIVEYLLAKSLAMGVLAAISTAILTVLTVGVKVAWLPILGLVFLAAVVVTLIALVVANLFRTISQFLFTGVVLNLALALPLVSYFVPSLSPLGFRLLPSYPLVFALREAYFPTGGGDILAGALWQTLVTFAIILPLATWTFKRQLAGRDA